MDASLHRRTAPPGVGFAFVAAGALLLLILGRAALQQRSAGRGPSPAAPEPAAGASHTPAPSPPRPLTVRRAPAPVPRRPPQGATYGPAAMGSTAMDAFPMGALPRAERPDRQVGRPAAGSCDRVGGPTPAPTAGPPLFAGPGGDPPSKASRAPGPAAGRTPRPGPDAAADLASFLPIDALLIDTPAPEAVSRVLAEDLRAAFALGRSGAVYAARGRFLAVLRRVAAAKDTEASTDRHSHALAAAVRALEEAEAFAPGRGAPAAPPDAAEIAATHQTPLLRGGPRPDGRPVSPVEAIARYHRYAEHKLGRAAAGNEAGSMALYGLGKTYARMHETDRTPLARKTSLTMYRAALAAHGQNFMAANELGVGLAAVGRYEAAEQALAGAVAAGGVSTVHRNLAFVQEKLGRARLAAAAAQAAERFAAVERRGGQFSQRRGVQWVSPDRLRRVPDAALRGGQAGPPGGSSPAPPPPTRPVDDPPGATQPPPTAAPGDRPAWLATRRFAPLGRAAASGRSGGAGGPAPQPRRATGSLPRSLPRH